MRVLPTQQRLHELFYCVNGVFYRKLVSHTSRHVSVGDICKSVNTQGYYQLNVDGNQYLTHRLVWKYYYGVDPVSVIDHMNGDKTDNSLFNLRDTTQRENVRNQSVIREQHNGMIQTYRDENGRRIVTPYGREIMRQRYYQRRQSK